MVPARWLRRAISSGVVTTTSTGTIAVLAVAAAAIAALLGLLRGGAGGLDLAWRTALAFGFGAVCSGVAGFIGMLVAVRSNLRTAAAPPIRRVARNG